MKRGQAAFEFLINYGVIILVVLVSIGTISYYGATELTQREECNFADDFSCAAFNVIQVDNQTIYFDVTLENPSTSSFLIQGLSIKQEDATVFCTTDKISTLQGGVADTKVLSLGGLKTLRFHLENTTDCDFRASGLRQSSMENFDVQLIYALNADALPLVSEGNTRIELAGPSEIPSNTCARAEVVCAAGCPFGVDGGTNGCYIDDQCLYSCVPLGPGEQVDVIELEFGENYISSNLEPSDTLLRTLFGPLINSGNVVSITTPDGFVHSSATGWFTTERWEYRGGYIIDVISDTPLVVTGTPQATSYTLELTDGTNIIGVPPGVTEPIIESFLRAIMDGSLLSITDKNGNTISAANNWTDTIGPAQPGSAYIIEMNGFHSNVFPEDIESYQIIQIQNGDNYVSPSLTTAVSAEEVFTPLNPSGGGALRVTHLATGNELRWQGGWRDDIGVVELGEVYNVEFNTDRTLVFLGEAKRDTLEYRWNALGTAAYIGIPDIGTIDPLTAFEQLIIDEVLLRVTDENGNTLTHDGTQWVNGLGQLQGGKGYYVELTTDYTQAHVLAERTNECAMSSTCQASCGITEAWSQNGNCYTDSVCALPCYACEADLSCTSCGGTGYSRNGGTCYAESTCTTLCSTCNPDPSCCYGTGGYSDGGICFADSSCSVSSCTFGQTIELQSSRGEEYISLYVEPEILETCEFFQELFAQDLQYVEDRFGSQIDQACEVSEGARGVTVDILRPYEGYKLVFSSIGPDYSWSNIEFDSSYSYSGDASITFFEEPELQLFGVPLGLAVYDAREMFAPMIDARLLRSITDPETGRQLREESLGDWVNEIGDLVPGKAYELAALGEYTLEFE